MTSPILWYANRGTGLVAILLLTASVLAGMLATRPGPGRVWWPRFATQGLHRYLAGLSLLLLTVHTASAIIDDYVDIRWWQAFVPFGGSYRPLYLGLGTVALDLFLAVALTSAFRTRLPDRLWRGVHRATYLAWALGLLHGIGIGTDAPTGWLRASVIGCVAVVTVVAVPLLIGRARHGRRAVGAA